LSAGAGEARRSIRRPCSLPSPTGRRPRRSLHLLNEASTPRPPRPAGGILQGDARHAAPHRPRAGASQIPPRFGCSMRSLSVSSYASRTTKGLMESARCSAHPGRHGGASQPAGRPCIHVDASDQETTMHGHGVRAAPQTGTMTPRWRGAGSSGRNLRMGWSSPRAITPHRVAGIWALPLNADRRRRFDGLARCAEHRR
jgi:hypothetical protein